MDDFLRIKLTKEFQDFESLIDNFSEDLTYTFQVQSVSAVEIIEAQTVPVLELDIYLPEDYSRFVGVNGDIIHWKKDGDKKIWVRALPIGDETENYLSVLGGRDAG